MTKNVLHYDCYVRLRFIRKTDHIFKIPEEEDSF